MATIKLTEKTVARLAAPTASGKQELYWDLEQPGFGVLCSGVSNTKIAKEAASPRGQQQQHEAEVLAAFTALASKHLDPPEPKFEPTVETWRGQKLPGLTWRGRKI